MLLLTSTSTAVAVVAASASAAAAAAAAASGCNATVAALTVHVDHDCLADVIKHKVSVSNVRCSANKGTKRLYRNCLLRVFEMRAIKKHVFNVTTLPWSREGRPDARHHAVAALARHVSNGNVACWREDWDAVISIADRTVLDQNVLSLNVKPISIWGFSVAAACCGPSKRQATSNRNCVAQPSA